LLSNLLTIFPFLEQIFLYLFYPDNTPFPGTNPFTFLLLQQHSLSWNKLFYTLTILTIFPFPETNLSIPLLFWQYSFSWNESFYTFITLTIFSFLEQIFLYSYYSNNVFFSGLNSDYTDLSGNLPYLPTPCIILVYIWQILYYIFI